MTSLKIDAIHLLTVGADAMAREGAVDKAFRLYEIANNLRLVMRGEAPFSEWGDLYTGAERDPIIINDALWPIRSLPRRAECATRLIKPDTHSPAFKVIGRDALAIKAGVRFDGHLFADDTLAPLEALEPGADYAVHVEDGVVSVSRAVTIPSGQFLLGGFHYAPGGRGSSACAGGDAIPAISPDSVWDIAFRPSCPDPRGMTLVTGPTCDFWCDIYLTGVNHLVDGTSRFGVTIADGADRPRDAAGAAVKTFDYAAASAAMAAHGKTLLSHDECLAAAFGVKENSAASRNPKVTGLDAERTSKFGLMQATGNLWIWGHDGNPDSPRASLFGGSWINGDSAGSRTADVGSWPGHSRYNVGARGRSDPLKPV